MAGRVMVPIPKMDVLMEDFTNMNALIQQFTANREELINARNSWEVFFLGYDDDPREIPDIPEVVNWIEQSVEAGLPWFYFMNADDDSMGLSTFMICCGAEHDPQYPNRYIFDKERILPFIKKNLDNLTSFAEEYDIPDSVGIAASDTVMNFIQMVIQGNFDQGQNYEAIDRTKQMQEAIERLSTLEDLYELNPKVKKYFKDGRLYYSYITGGGYIGSIDTINYDERYATIVESFEAQTSYLVYHVIERGNTIALLFVSGDYNDWLDERPTSAGAMAHIVDVETLENEMGYIKIDCFNGALYRINDSVLHSKPEEEGCTTNMSRTDEEIAQRLEIFKTIGLETDLDITKVYIQEGEICCSIFKSIMGMPIGIVNRISTQPLYEEITELLSRKVSKKFYFVMSSIENEIAFLFLDEDSKQWEKEKIALERKIANAVVVDPEEMTATIKRIVFKMVNGGPIFMSE